jgi:hypothetical protein
MSQVTGIAPRRVVRFRFGFLFTCASRIPRLKSLKKLRYGFQKTMSITCQPHPPFLAATEQATRSRVRMPAHKKRKKL